MFWGFISTNLEDLCSSSFIFQQFTTLIYIIYIYIYMYIYIYHIYVYNIPSPDISPRTFPPEKNLNNFS